MALKVEGVVDRGMHAEERWADVFLHYVVDLWVHQWRRRKAAGQVIVCSTRMIW